MSVPVLKPCRELEPGEVLERAVWLMVQMVDLIGDLQRRFPDKPILELKNSIMEAAVKIDEQFSKMEEAGPEVH
jgi:hypothetical protein